MIMNTQIKNDAIIYVKKVDAQILITADATAGLIRQCKENRSAIRSLKAHRDQAMRLYGLTEDEINGV